MPTSPYSNTVYVLDLLSGLPTHSVLDVGAGFGRWGFLCRCHLGGGESLTAVPRQRIRIDAVEIHRPNISPVYPAVYDHTYEGDARSVLPSLGQYDVIICGDMIEHLEKQEAWALIENMKKRARHAVLLAMPFGDCPQGAIGGNEFETHRSTWGKEDFKGREVVVKEFPFLAGRPSAVVFWPLSDEARWTAKMMTSPVRRWLWTVWMRGRSPVLSM